MAQRSDPEDESQVEDLSTLAGRTEFKRLVEAAGARFTEARTEFHKDWVKAALFYSGHDYLRYKRTWIGRWLPRRIRRMLPVRWLGRWVASGDIRPL